MRLVAYLRISSTTQLEGFGLEVQRKAVRQWVKAHGHRIVAEYVDAGVSGATDAVDRPALSDALEQIGWPSRADGIIATRLDRLARALTVQEAILALCWREGARVFTADAGEVLRDDPDDPMRVVMRQMGGVFSELTGFARILVIESDLQQGDLKQGGVAITVCRKVGVFVTEVSIDLFAPEYLLFLGCKIAQRYTAACEREWRSAWDWLASGW